MSGNTLGLIVMVILLIPMAICAFAPLFLAEDLPDDPSPEGSTSDQDADPLP